jgi:hypothetical protein
MQHPFPEARSVNDSWFRPNLNRHLNKDPQRTPVFFNEKSS